MLQELLLVENKENNLCCMNRGHPTEELRCRTQQPLTELKKVLLSSVNYKELNARSLKNQTRFLCHQFVVASLWWIPGCTPTCSFLYQLVRIILSERDQQGNQGQRGLSGPALLQIHNVMVRLGCQGVREVTSNLRKTPRPLRNFLEYTKTWKLETNRGKTSGSQN